MKLSDDQDCDRLAKRIKEIESLKEYRLEDYKERIIAYLDILGFSKFIEDANADPETLRELFELVKEFHSLTVSNKPDFTRLEITFLSDSLLISTPNNKEMLLPLIRYVGEIQGKLLTEGYLSRGSIVIGNAYHNQNEFFGQGVLCAMKLEKKTDYPKVLLGKSVVDPFSEICQSDLVGKQHIEKDKYDDRYFINYLCKWFGVLDHSNSNKIENHIRRNIENSSHPERAKMKWNWMQDYFKKECREQVPLYST